MKIAILLSAYNGVEYIESQLESLLNQKNTFDIDIIVRDDGSNDGTQDILDKFQSEGKLRWYQGQNQKSARSFISLIRENRGYDFYFFSDQDDIWDSDKVEIGISKIADIDKPAICCGNARLVDRELKPINRNVFRKKPHYSFYSILCRPEIQGCTAVFNNRMAELIQNVEMPSIITMHDSYLGRVCLAVDGLIIYDEVPHMSYRIHEKNVVGLQTSNKSGKKSIIKSRINEIKRKEPISISDQAKEIMRLYGDRISDKNKKILNRVINYKKNIFSRLALACSIKTKYTTKNVGLTNRLKIFLGNK